MGPTLVIARGRSVYLLDGPRPPRRFPRSAGDREPAALIAALQDRASTGPVLVCGPQLVSALEGRVHHPVRAADPDSWHAALRALPQGEQDVERAYVLERARADLLAALASPEEVLVSLAREEERLERAVGREDRAAEAFVRVPATVLEEVADAWSRARAELRAHHHRVAGRLEEEARRLLPNLSAVVGARTAARLVAAAGGIAPLARVSSARLQLLGARRRPSPERGPRYGVLFLADGADAVPPERRGAYVRSVAALAAIAVRADALTHAAIAPGLVRRRDARRGQLQRSRR